MRRIRSPATNAGAVCRRAGIHARDDEFLRRNGNAERAFAPVFREIHVADRHVVDRHHEERYDNQEYSRDGKAHRSHFATGEGDAFTPLSSIAFAKRIG